MIGNKPDRQGCSFGSRPSRWNCLVRLSPTGKAGWNWDEDRCTLRTGHGPENITRLRRFATGLIKSKSRDSVAATIRKFARNVRHVFDYLRLTGNSIPRSQRACAQAG
jgi:hypothetical protein